MRAYLNKLLAVCCWLLVISQPILASPDTKDIFNLKLRVDPPDTIRCGDVITVFIEFENVSGALLRNYEVRAFFPNEIEKYCRLGEVLYATKTNVPHVTDLGSNTYAVWRIGDLHVGERDSIIFRLNVHWVPNRTVFFTYTATARATNASTSEVSFFHTFVPERCVPGPIPEIGINKQADKPTASVGDAVRFSLNLSNNSADTAYTLTVEDSIPRGLAVDLLHISHPFVDQRIMPNGVQVIRWLFPGKFLPGARSTITIPTTVALNPRIPTQLINQCDLVSDTPDGNNSNNHAEIDVTIVPKYDIRLTFLGEKDKTIDPNSEEEYTLEISNRSTVQVENFNLILNIDDGFADQDLYTISPDGISHGGTSPDNVNVRWQIVALDSGQTLTRWLRLKYDRVGVGNRARCVNFVAVVDTVFEVLNTQQRDLNPTDNQASWKRCLNDAFDLVLEPTPANNKTVVVNQAQTYKLELTNRALFALPEFTLYAQMQPTGPTLANNIIVANPRDNGVINGLQITWTIPSLAANATASRTFEATIAGINAGGTFGFILTGEAQVFAGESDATNNRRTWETKAAVVTNLLVEEVSTNKPEAKIGEKASVQIAYANRGSLDKDRADLRAVITVTPDMPIYRIENIGDNGQQVNANTITWAIQPLPATGAAARGTRSFDLVFDNITQGADYNIKIVGVIERFDASDDIRDNRDSTRIHLDALPRLGLSDIGLEGELESEEVLTYSFGYGNAGNFPARDATLKLTLPQATSFVAWLDANGQSLSPEDLGNQQRLANLGELPPGFQTSNTIQVKVMNRQDLLHSFAAGTSIDFKIEVTLAAGNVAQPLFKSRTDRLVVPQLVESFYLTRNTYRPDEHGSVEMYIDVTEDTEVQFKIYNLAGELVRTLTPVSGVIGSRVRQLWDGRNNNGELVASGLYFIFAEVGYKSERPYRKLVVVR